MWVLSMGSCPALPCPALHRTAPHPTRSAGRAEARQPAQGHARSARHEGQVRWGSHCTTPPRGLCEPPPSPNRSLQKGPWAGHATCRASRPHPHRCASGASSSALPCPTLPCCSWQPRSRQAGTRKALGHVPAGFQAGAAGVCWRRSPGSAAPLQRARSPRRTGGGSACGGVGTGHRGTVCVGHGRSPHLRSSYARPSKAESGARASHMAPESSRMPGVHRRARCVHCPMSRFQERPPHRAPCT